MSTEHPANYLTIFNGDGEAVQATLDQVLDTMKEQLGGENPSELPISSGSITPTSGAHSVDAGTSSADLTNIETTYLMEGQLLLLWPADEQSITVKHEAGGPGQITLRNGADVTLDRPDKYVLLQRLVDDWQEAGHLGNIVDPADMMRLEAVREGVQLSRENDVLDLNKGAVKIHEEAGGSDQTVSGAIVTMTAAADLVGTLGFGDICYVDENGQLKKADADKVATTTSVVMAMETMAADVSGSVLLRGFVRDDSWSWTPGGVVYASDTEGVLTQIPGSGAVLGIATSATRMHFTPDKTLTTRQLWVDENAGGADLTASGAITSMTAGDSLSFGDLCYVDVNGQMQKVDASGADANPVTAMALATITNGNSGTFLVRGFVRDDSWSWTTGGVVYATGTTGGMTQSDASGPVVGVATASNLMHFTPDKTLSTRQMRLNEEAGGADLTASGTVVTLTAGEVLGFGDVCYLDSVSGKYKKADVDDVATFPGIVMALETINADAPGMFLLRGFVRDDSWSWTTGAVIYGSATAGDLSEAASTGAVLGVATGSKYIHFTPDKAVVSQQLAMELNEAGGTTDHTALGITVTMTAGENLDEDDQPVDLEFGDVCYVDEYGKLTKATAHIATDTPVRAMALETFGEDEPGKVLLTGFVRDDSWDWTVGGLVYLSAEAGQLTQTKPTGSGEMIQAVGVATNADRIFFDPNSCFTRNDGELRGVFFYPYEVGNSCLFTAADSTYMDHTPASQGDMRKWTFSCWMKTAKWNVTGTNVNAILAVNQGAGSGGIYFYSNNLGLDFSLQEIGGSGRTIRKITDMLFRDFNAWYNIVIQLDTAQVVADDRVSIWVNGVEITDFNTVTNTTNQSDQLCVLDDDVHTMGRQHQYTRHNDMYVAQHCICSGTAYTADDFGEFVNGIWVPKDVSDLTFGAQGWLLDFADSASLGADVSGGSNNWTTSGITAANQSSDTPTNNFCTGDVLQISGAANNWSEGNLKSTDTGGYGHVANFEMVQGKWYWEVEHTTVGSPYPVVGVQPTDGGRTSYAGGMTPSVGKQSSTSFYIDGSSSGTYDAFSAGDISIHAYDADTRKYWIGRNGVWFNSGDPAAETGEVATVSGTANMCPSVSNHGGTVTSFNFGGTDIIGIASGNPDANGYGSFIYDPTAINAAGFMALCSANMADPTVGECANDPGVKAIAYIGTGASLPITGIGFQPDLVIILGNDATKECAWYSSVRGVGKYIDSYYQNTHIAEVTDAQSLTSFDVDGFTLGTSSASNGNGSDYVAYCFKKGAAYGVDIVEYTGTGSARTVAHSLGVPPEAMFVKNITVNREIVLYHEGSAADAETDYSLLDVNASFADDITMWNDTAPDAANFTVGTNDYTNESGQTHIAFLFASIDGVSSFGSFEGNANVDGPFVNTGFRPEIFWSFRAASTNNYICSTDVEIHPDNPTGDTYIYINAGMGTGHATFTRDMVSNGYKIRTNNITYNGAITHVYFAWAAQPFKYANAR